ncbi:MAG TPA: DUF3291 domain-containing protein [Mycobacteriales bacterium]|jgi:hypothetical protein|nr:DUF3291 domain-containing protein [Mycobacteriales bacterium]
MHLAQINVGRIRAPRDHPTIAGFMARLEPINALADASPGFVWRFVSDEADDATSVRPYPDDDLMLINFSVWESRQALWDFVYRSAHLEAMRRRREWFERMAESFQALWWVPEGHRPTVTEALDRLKCLQQQGSTPFSFTFREFFDSAAVADTTPERRAT